MDLHVSEADGITVAAVEGEIDTNSAPLVQQQILPLASPGVRLVLDMSKVPYMSSAGIRVLLTTYRQVTGKGGHVVLVGIADDVKETLSITGFLKFFQTYDTLEDGRQAVTAS